MSYSILQQIQTWNQKTNPIQVVLMKSSIEKAFSVGGDLKDYYYAGTTHKSQPQNTREEIYSLQA